MMSVFNNFIEENIELFAVALEETHWYCEECQKWVMKGEMCNCGRCK